MVSFNNEIHSCYYEFQATVFATVCYPLTLFLHFVVGWFCFCEFCFYDNARMIKGSKENSHGFFSSKSQSHSLTFNLQTYRTTLHTPYYPGYGTEAGVLKKLSLAGLAEPTG
jgi:hypothetical protein